MITMLERNGDIKVLADTRTLKGSQAIFGGLMPAASLYAPSDFVKKYPHTVQALTNAIVRADKWLQTAKPGDLIRVVPESYLLNDKALYLTAFNNLREAYSPDGIIPDESPKVALRALAGFLPDFKPEQIKLDQTYTNRFAIAANQKYK
jgi:NitT/TauT family transport system substrate-binding protein